MKEKQERNWQYYQSTLNPVGVLWREAKKKLEITNYPVPLNVSVNNC